MAFTLQTIARDRRPRITPRTVRMAAAGIAWERALIMHVEYLLQGHGRLQISAERWKPPRAGIDLDLIVQDPGKAVVWILDAKLAKPADSQVQKMRRQIQLLQARPDLTGDCPTIIGLIVHHRRHLHAHPETTCHRHVVRCTLQDVGDLLLAQRLPASVVSPTD